MTSFEKSLTSYKKNEHKSGFGFEELTKWYLENSPQYKSMFEVVWHWDDLPFEWGSDDGIDLIAKTISGEFWAIQSKNYDPKYYIKKSDIDSFLSASNRPEISYRLLIGTTDNLGPKARKTLENQEKPVGTILYSNLINEDIEWPIYEEKKSFISINNKPDPHQKDAIKKVSSKLKTEKKGQLIMACGTGKTLTSLWIDESLNNELTCIFVPSISLIEQTFKEWIINSNSGFKFLTVCSDKTVTDGKDYDLIKTRTYELGIPTTTDKNLIAKFMNQDGKKVIFSTYHSSKNVYEAQKISNVSIDLILADEAHSLTGISSSDNTKKSEYVLKDELLNSNMKLFMTATPKGVIKQIKNKASENDLEVFSMDDPNVFGKVFHRLSFGEAIKQKLLSDYEIIILDIKDPFVIEKIDKNIALENDGKNYSAFALSTQIALIKVAKKLNIRRVITFHNLIKKAKLFSETLDDANSMTFEDGKFSVWSKSIDGSMSAISRKNILNELKTNEFDLNIVSNARCLSEGVDVPTLDGVAFIDPKESVIQIIQAIGRAIRQPRGSKPKTGYIFVPVVIDESEELDLEKDSYHQIWKVFQALMAHDERLSDELKEIKLNKSIYGKKSKMPKINWGEIPERIDRFFIESIETKIITDIHGSWFENFEKLINYYKLHKTSRVPDHKKSHNRSLGKWVQRQRYFFRKGLLSQEKINLLIDNFHDWSFNPDIEKREEILQEWKDYELRYGEVNITSKDSGRVSASLWEFYRRVLRDYETNNLSTEILEQITSIFPDFNFEPLEMLNFKKAVQEWKKISEIENEIYLTPKQIKKHNPRYLNSQRPMQIRNKKQKLDKEKIDYLKSIFPEFKFESKNEIKERLAKELFEDYVDKVGTAYIRTDAVYKGQPIGKWAQEKRIKYHAVAKTKKHLKLSKNEIDYFEKFLDKGWHWGVSKIKNRSIMKDTFIQFVEERDTAYIPKKLIYKDLRLGNWAHNIRMKYSDGKLSNKEIKFYEEYIPLGWYWEKPKLKYQRLQKEADRKEARKLGREIVPKNLEKEKFEIFEQYVKEKGTAYIPVNEIYKGEKIGQWAVDIRHRYRATLPRYKYKKLPDDVIKYFESYIEYGWNWGGNNSHLINRDKKDLILFQEYVKEKGTAYIPANAIYKGQQIGRWAQSIRGRYHNVSKQFKGRKLEKKDIDFFNTYIDMGWYWGKPRKYTDK
tara:strand:- start:116 stop:3715 length:3600 start_codon:yes stop_codon:yes gene_type:complete